MKAQVAGPRSIRKVVITRSRKGNADLAKSMANLGFDPVAIDTLDFLPPEDWSQVDAALSKLSEFDWLLFTSVTGVDQFAKRMSALALSTKWRGRPKVGAVGEKTGAAVKKEGIKVAFVPTVFVTRALAEQLPRDQGKRVLLLRADVGDPEAASILERAGFEVHDVTIYRTIPISPSDDAPIERELRDADAIVFASPSAVEGFIQRLGPVAKGSVLPKRLLAVCIGPVTERAAREHGFERLLTSKTHTIDGVLQTLKGAAAEGEGK